MSREDWVPEQVKFPYEVLRRWPDAEAGNLFASDATDRLIVDLAASTIRSTDPGSVVVIGDRYGALTLASLSLGAIRMRVHQDSFTGQLALAANKEILAQGGIISPGDFENLPLGEELLVGAEAILIQIPKDLTQFEHWIRLVATYAETDVRVYAGGRIKHMTVAMNEVLGRYFSDISASLARKKSRVLFATNLRQPRPAITEAVTETYDRDLDLWICSMPGSFASGKVDQGSRFLVDFMRALPHPIPDSELVAADLGCGTGVLASVLAQSYPEYHLIATDRSAAAVQSAQKTLDRNVPGGDWEVREDNALSKQADSSLDLIVCNPPFHSDAAISTELSELLFADAARALKPGGVMLTVFNSHLPHRRSLERLIGPTKQLGRNPKFTVTRSVRR